MKIILNYKNVHFYILYCYFLFIYLFMNLFIYLFIYLFFYSFFFGGGGVEKIKKTSKQVND